MSVDSHLDAGSEPTPPDAIPLVVVGASAGGVEALSVFVAGLPTPFPAPIVVAQHLDPRRRSQLPEVLGPRSTLPVRVVEDRLTLEPGVIYLVPADRNVEISDNQVSVQGDSSRHRPMPSIDRLLTSASRVFGERLIAVILSGLGTDGAIGARHVKAAGGTVVVQDPRTADFPAMPQALAPDVVDIVSGPDRLGVLLSDLLSGTYPVTAADEERLLAGVARARSRSKRDRLLELQAPDDPAPPPAADGRHRRHPLRDYVRYVQEHPEEYERLVSSFLIKVTEFFRDPELFEFLREIAIPEVIDEARQRGNEIRIWSAGCATGEEAYSIAMLVAEALGDELSTFNVRIFATDLDGDAIALRPARGVPVGGGGRDRRATCVERYFSRDRRPATRWQGHPRRWSVFGQHDLAQRRAVPAHRHGLLPERADLLHAGAPEAGAAAVRVRAA